MPAKSKVITGWMGGRIAQTHASMPTEQLKDLALSSLSGIFNIKKNELNSILEEAHIVNWANDPYTFGSYAYTTVGASRALAQLSTPLEGRVFFAGEYLYEG